MNESEISGEQPVVHGIPKDIKQHFIGLAAWGFRSTPHLCLLDLLFPEVSDALSRNACGCLG